VAAVIAGWIAGYAMAILSTFAVTFLFLKAKDPTILGRRFFPEGVPPTLIAVPASLAAFLLWTIIGLVLGSAYEVLDLQSKANALGSPSAPFLIAIAALAIIPLPLLILIWPRRWPVYVLMSGSFLGLFGWLMPLLAERNV
jgi:hypothetical protein